MKTTRRSVFDETDWTDVNRKDDIAPYYKSKALAEKVAWDFIKSDHSGFGSGHGGRVGESPR
jgi:hypothetical protein